MKTLLILVLFFLVLSGSTFSQTTYENLSRSKALTDQIPVRDIRKTAVWLNMGWNGITGFGALVSYFVVPKIAVDAGLGLSSEGIKISGRGRYLFTTKNFTPFAGLGFMYGLGTPTDFESTDPNNNDEIYRIKVNESPFIQITGGFEYMAKKGFFTLFNVGYAILLKSCNYEITAGNPVGETRKALDMAFGSGIVIEGGIGYAF